MPERYSIDQDSCAWRIVDGEAILIHSETTYYYGLDAIGTKIWQILLDGPASGEELAARLAEDDPASPNREAIQGFLDRLVEEQILVTGAGATSERPGVTGDDASALASGPPVLTKYDSLDELLISGE